MDYKDFDNLQTESECILVPNAGLALLSVWFPRLFSMFGLLSDDKKDFKDTEARIRAIFALQYLVGMDKHEFSEQELAFNRILVNCPFSVPLPRQLELSKEEKEILDSMLNGVKSNWTKMQNTSIMGFQHSFINRDGRLNQEEKRWMLTVNERAYDILLDSLPWQFREIRFPWLEKRICVYWRSEGHLYY